jgi:hypothetical protein
MERRRQDRNHLVHYLILYDPATDQAIGNMIDVNPEGLRFISPSPLPVGAMTEIKMIFPEPFEGKSSLLFEGVVRWCGPDVNPDMYALGLEIQLISPDDLDLLLHLIAAYHDAEA